MLVDHKASTRKCIENARKSFETITGKKVKGATTQDIEQWLHSLRSMGRSTSTCRTYLSFVKHLAGLEIELPAREQNEKRRILSDIELKIMLGIVSVDFYALLASLLINGTSVLNWAWSDLTDPTLDISIAAKMILVNEAGRRGRDTHPLLSYGTSPHWVNEVPRDETIFSKSAHSINLRLKTLAKKAGISDPQNVSLTTIKASCVRLWSEYRTADGIVKALGIKITGVPSLLPAQPIIRRDTRLHGIGRRSPVMKTA